MEALSYWGDTRSPEDSIISQGTENFVVIVVKTSYLTHAFFCNANKCTYCIIYAYNLSHSSFMFWRCEIDCARKLWKSVFVSVSNYFLHHIHGINDVKDILMCYQPFTNLAFCIPIIIFTNKWKWNSFCWLASPLSQGKGSGSLQVWGSLNKHFMILSVVQTL
jgi:hypothetical protein